MEEIFDPGRIDVTQLNNAHQMLPDQNLKWWDVGGKTYKGGNFSLPNARYMNVAIQKQSNGYLVYIQWFQT